MKQIKKHEESRAKLMDNFFSHVEEKQAPILGSFYGTRVYHDVFFGWVPNLILMLAGASPSLAFRSLASSTLCCWILDVRKKMWQLLPTKLASNPSTHSPWRTARHLRLRLQPQQRLQLPWRSHGHLQQDDHRSPQRDRR